MLHVAILATFYIAFETLITLEKLLRGLLAFAMTLVVLGSYSLYAGGIKFPRYRKPLTYSMLGVGVALVLFVVLKVFILAPHLISFFDIVQSQLGRGPIAENEAREKLSVFTETRPVELELEKVKELEWLRVREFVVVVEKYEPPEKWNLVFGNEGGSDTYLEYRAVIDSKSKEVAAVPQRVPTPGLSANHPIPVICYLEAKENGVYTIHFKITTACGYREQSAKSKSMRIYVTQALAFAPQLPKPPPLKKLPDKKA